MAKSSSPRSRMWIPENPLNGLRGINVTAAEQTTIATELSGGQNVFTDINGGVYNRNGSLVLGGIFDNKNCQGGWVFRDNAQRVVPIAVANGIIYYYNNTTFVKVPSSPTLSTTLPVSGVFYPDVNKFYLTNGLDSVVELDLSTGSLTATSKPAIQKSLYIGYSDHHLFFINLPSQPNIFSISDQGATTTNAASVTATAGYLLGMANLDLYNSIMITDQRCYRMAGITASYDAANALVYGPGSFIDIGRSRAVAPRSIVMVNGRVYWIGLDDFNNVEIYQTEGQTVKPVGWEKLKTYLRTLNTTALSNACATSYGIYAKFAVPGSGSSYNNQELLMDTVRTIQVSVPGVNGPPTVIWEPVHIPGYNITQYATYTSGGQDYILAFDAMYGLARRQGVGYFDEAPLVTTFPDPGAAPATGSITVIPTTTNLTQPYTPTVTTSIYPLTIALRVTAFSAGSGVVTFSLQTDNAGNPSGTVIESVTYAVTATPPPILSATFANPNLLTTGTLYHIVVSVTGGNLTVQKLSATTLPLPYKTGTTGTWAAGTGNPVFMLTYQQDIDSFFVQTTCLERPFDKKKMTRFLLNGISASGANMTIGIGNQGRDSIFSDSSFFLGGSSAVWSPSSGTVLTWAAPGDALSATNGWASQVPDFEKTVYPNWYNIADYFLSFRFRHVGQSDWRINTYTPISAVVPSTRA